MLLNSLEVEYDLTSDLINNWRIFAAVIFFAERTKSFFAFDQTIITQIEAQQKKII